MPAPDKRSGQGPQAFPVGGAGRASSVAGGRARPLLAAGRGQFTPCGYLGRDEMAGAFGGAGRHAA